MDTIEDTRAQQTLDVALRIGEMLLSSGAGAADVAATMSSITVHAGLRPVQSDVTFTSLELSWQPRGRLPLTVTRHVRQRETDYADLTEVDLLISELLSDEVSIEEARDRLNKITSTGHARPRWRITVSWALIGAGIALLLGGDALVVGAASLAAALIELTQRRLARLRLPFFYTQAAGGLLVTGLAAGAEASSLPVDPSLVVTTGIVQLLAGLGLIGATQDALTGFYVTASARVVEVLISTAGIIAGVALGLRSAETLGVELYLDPSAAGWTEVPMMVAGAGIAAAGFAYSVYAPLRAIAPVGVLAAFAAAIYLSMTTGGWGPAGPSAVAATVIGFASWFVGRTVRVPPLVVVVPCIVPLLPGLSIYRGLTQLSADNLTGILSMITAISVALALASGVILGEYIAQPLGREARRLEQRLAGPRLVGPLRERSARRRG